MTHHKEPWFVEVRRPRSSHSVGAAEIWSPVPEPVATMAYYRDQRHQANARRIVACVNACQGLTTERLENIVKEGESILIRWDRDRKAFDELLDAMRKE